MGLFGRIFGKKKGEPAPGSREAKQRFNAALDELMGITDRADLSRNGHPVCPKCAYEFPWSKKYVEENSAGRPLLVCPDCGTRMSV